MKKKEDPDASIGNALDALDREMIVSQGENVSTDEKVNEKKKKEKRRRNSLFHKKMMILAGVPFLFLCAAGTFLTQWVKPEEAKESVVERFAITQNPPIVFSHFVIPLPNGRDFTYVSLSLSLILDEPKLRNEIMERMEELRGVIYYSLYERFNRPGDAPTLEILKPLILEEVNGALFSGKITELCIGQFIVI